MCAQPVHKRDYHTFLSHASKDKNTIVENMFEWLEYTAKIHTWYDRDALSGGANFAMSLADAITDCRSLTLILSEASVASGWVEEEWSIALNHEKEYKEFKIIPVKIDECTVPTALSNRTYIDLPKLKSNIFLYDEILKSLYGDNTTRANKDIYISRTWRDSEAQFADHICKSFINARFRLIGDAEDQPNYEDTKQRVDDIVSSCGGLLAILPYRGDKSEYGFTSNYMLNEIGYAQKYNIPFVILAEAGVIIPDQIGNKAAFVAQSANRERMATDDVNRAVEMMRDQFNNNHKRHYVFYVSSFDDPHRNELVRRAIERITGMECIQGKRGSVKSRLAGISIQREIIEQIKGAFLVIGDISQNPKTQVLEKLQELSEDTLEIQNLIKDKLYSNVNSIIEIGIAKALNISHLTVARSPSRKPPFLFRDEETEFYSNEVELLGIMHSLVYPFRRRILNNELQK